LIKQSFPIHFHNLPLTRNKFFTFFEHPTQLCLKMAEFCFCFADEINKTKAS